jgi:hypothetical protein
MGLTKCDSVLVNNFHFHFDFSWHFFGMKIPERFYMRPWV